MRRDYRKVEENFYIKKWRGRVPIALVFPVTYELGMSNLGFLTLYERLNSYNEIVCERVFYDEGEIRSLEGNRLLKDFPIILFSVPFEGNYVEVLKILKKSGLSFNPKENSQILLGGGVALWSNPEPLAPFLDGFLLGEWEALEESLVPLFIDYAFNKETLLNKLLEFDFFYSPFYTEKRKVKIAKISLLSKPLKSNLLSEKAKFGKSYLIEVSKGCGRSCRFCLAGYIYRPPRSYPVEGLLEVLEEIPPYSKVGLIGLEFANKEEVKILGSKLLSKNCILTFSSLRIESLEKDFLELLKSTKTIALAPETASLKLKKIINKPILEEDLIKTLENLKTIGIKKVKLYFMIGLPFEEIEDIKETTGFIKKLLNLKLPFQLVFSFSFFVPKPHTPFQWVSLLDPKEMKRRKNFIQKELSEVKNLKFESLNFTLLQAILARGSSQLKHFLLSLAQENSLSRSLREIKDLNLYLSPPEERDFSFPWDFIETGVSKEFLWKEWERAKAQKTTPFCLPQKCNSCSACSLFSRLKIKGSSIF